MMRAVKFLSQEGQFALTEDQSGAIFLEVLCGGFAMYELEMQLSADEVAAYQMEGPSILSELAEKIRRRSDNLNGRVREK